VTVALDARPRLHAKARLRVDAHSGQMMLLYPERGLQLNPTGREVLELCTGAATVGEIAAALSARHGASTDVVLAEVRTFLDGLAARGLLAGLDEVAP
jgi:pyrroloquinoline quinone biosynthesis protein D